MKENLTVPRFRQWKSFRCWRKALSRHKFQSAKQVIQERHFINYADLRKTYCEIQDVLSGISDMGMIEVGPTRTYTLTEFCQEQEDRWKSLQIHTSFSSNAITQKTRNKFLARIQKLDTKLLEFRNLIRETVYDACRLRVGKARRDFLKIVLDLKLTSFKGAPSLRLASTRMITARSWKS